MKNIRRLLSIALSLLIIISAVPAMLIPASAEIGNYDNLFLYEIKNDEATVTECLPYGIQSSGIYIPDTLGGYPVTAVADEAFQYCAGSAIVLPDTVRSIGTRAFSECVNLSYFQVPSALVSIGEYAFEDCVMLEAINLPAGVTSVEKGTFYNCKKLASVTVPDGILSVCEDAFYGCALRNIYLPASVANVYNAFSCCMSFEDIYYAGTVSRWGEVYGYNNVGSESVVVHYNSQRGQTHNKQVSIECPATCQAAGLKRVSCSCGIEAEIEIPKIDHDYTFSRSVAAACTAQGYDVYTCRYCGVEEQRNITPPTGHNYVNDVCTACGEEIPTIQLGEIKECFIPAGQTVYFKFKPEASGNYSFFSDALDDTYGVILNRYFNETASDDDGGDDANFLIRFDFDSVVYYYLGIRFYNEENQGSVYVGLVENFTSCHNPEIRETKPTCTEAGRKETVCTRCGYVASSVILPALGHNYVNDICTRCSAKRLIINPGDILKVDSISADSITYYRFIPEDSGTYTFFSDSQDDTMGYLTDENFDFITENDDDENDLSFLITYDFIAGQTYYLGIKLFSSVETERDTYIGLVSEFTSHHNYEQIVVKEPACTEEGYAKTVCTRCGFTASEEEIPMLGHDFVDGYCIRCSVPEHCDHHETEIVGQCDPTCEEYGYTGTLVCKICGEYLQGGDYIPMHFLTKELIMVVEPTCLKNGYTLYRCTECGKEFKTDQTWKQHTKGELVRTVKPACEKEGYSVYKCAECGYEISADWIDPLGHELTEIKTVAPTCEQKGYTLYNCGRCHAFVKDDYTDALGHDFADGVCARCGDTPRLLELNEFTTVEIDEPGGVKLFAYTPETTGTYSFYSDTQWYVVGCLYDSQMNLIEEADYAEYFYEDDEYYDHNFLITYALEAGKTYYFSARYSGTYKTGSFDVCLTDSFTKIHDYVYRKTVGPTCTNEGYDLYVCKHCEKKQHESLTDAYGGAHDYVNDVCTRCGQIRGIYPQEGSTCVVDRENKLIYGLVSFLDQEKLFSEFLDISDDTWCFADIKLGTGSKLSVFDEEDDELIDVYTVLLYGDVNGDGIYDGEDAMIVNCLVNGLVSADQTDPLKYAAADCDHDGEVTALDVQILEQAGILISQIGQAEDAAGSDAYIEYISLIDQNPQAEEDPQEPSGALVDEPSDAAPQSFIVKLIALLQRVILFIRSLFPKI